MMLRSPYHRVTRLRADHHITRPIILHPLLFFYFLTIDEPEKTADEMNRTQEMNLTTPFPFPIDR